MENTRSSSHGMTNKSRLLLTLKELQLQTRQHLSILGPQSSSRSIKSHTSLRMVLLMVLRLNLLVCNWCLSVVRRELIPDP